VTGAALTTPQPSESKLCYIGFNHVKGIGAMRLKALLDVFGDAPSAWRADTAALRRTGLNEKLIEALITVRGRLNLEDLWQRITAFGIQVITWEDEIYPQRLKEITQPPPVLYVRGSLLAEDDFSVAVVGTRRVSAYGRRAAEELAALLAQNGITLISGMARGVDGIAHDSALKSGGRTLAVFGCGVDHIYPPEHRSLAERIQQNGALISDYPPGTKPDANNFPPRNRIISALARAVVVVEAGDTSGSLITAKFGVEQGRDVFAIPGSIFSHSSRGVNRLISDGATPLVDLRDLLQAMDLGKVTEYRAARCALPETPLEAQILMLLDQEPAHVDEIRARSGLPVDQVSATLIMMELKGMVAHVGGMKYIIKESV